MAIENKIEVHAKTGTPIHMINSLCIISDDHLLFNRYETPYVYLVNLKTGEYMYYWDFSNLVLDQKRKATNMSQSDKKLWEYDNAMNGIVWLGVKEFLLTGKMWSGAYKVRLNNLNKFK